MSIVAAAVKNGKIAIAADSQVNFGSLTASSKYMVGEHKIFKIQDSFIGLVGWSATCLATQHLFNKHQDKLDFKDRYSIFESLLKIQKILKDDYFFETREDDDDQPVESNQIDGLIINSSGLFKISSYRDVTEYSKFWAVGAGRPYALGAMFASFDSLENAKDIAESGAHAASEFSDSCGLPLQVFELDLKADESPAPDKAP